MTVLKNYDKRIRVALIICFLSLAVCLILGIGSILIAQYIVSDVNKNVYLLEGTAPTLIHGKVMDETLDVEAKSHVELFHHLFFTLTPDEEYIDYTIKKALCLVDESGAAQYNALKEKGFYNNIVGASSVFCIFCDSIKFDQGSMEWTYYGRQRIERRTNILVRQLVTSGKIKRVPRTDDNPHGMLITDWRTVLNKDIEQRQKGIIN